ncbi:MAG: 4Fe-4S binding protein [Bacillota bacterium]
MGHLTRHKEEVYRALAERLNKNPIGAPVNEFLIAILHRLYTESEAELASKFPLLPMPLEKIAGITGVDPEELKKILSNMADKGLVLDLPRRDGIYYMLAPMVVGFFEYTFMRTRQDLDMKELAELFEKYFHSQGVAEEIFGSSTKMFRSLVYESLLPAAVETEVLTYERASGIIRGAGFGALSLCACRHKASHLGKACGAPVEDVCTSLGNAARWLVSRGFAREATVDEMLRVLEKTEKLGLVHLGDNVLSNPTFICHCCGCCCGVLRAINESGVASVLPSNFIPEVDEEACSGCGTCAERCHIHAIRMVPGGNGAEVPVVNKELCIGCGVCAAGCPTEALIMSRRSVLLPSPPKDKKEQLLAIAGEKGRI